MSIYGDMDEDQLEAEIASLRAKIRAVGTSPQAGVRSIAGEGRRVEFFAGGGGASLADLRRLLRDALDQLSYLRNGGGSAIGVTIP